MRIARSVHSECEAALERRLAELEQAYEATIEGWVRALDLRDGETEGHSRRVADLAVALAERMGVCGAQLGHVRRGALLHDVGKMGLPDAILLKPGPLSLEEEALMRRHPDFAVSMLRDIPYLAPALDIPWAHHERWDGTGYPRGLSGDAIPFAARLFSVVDVFDAMHSDRPYRTGLPAAEVLGYIREGAGTLFDPRVAVAFAALMEPRLESADQARDVTAGRARPGS